jgi:dTDP-4-dehydrorhamnose 3,5-epimerase
MAVQTLPEGVVLHPLASHRDERGSFTELFREEWATGIRPVQWNAVASEAAVLRGVHVHVRHADYLTVVRGRAIVGLRDLRAASATAGLATCIELSADAMAAIVIPTRVAHGFLFTEPSMHVYAVSHYWDVEDELGCHWADPELGIPWPAEAGEPRLSPRDAAAPPLKELLARLSAGVAAAAR